MAENNTLWALIAVFALLLGVFVGAEAFAKTTTLTQTVTKEVQVPVNVTKEVPIIKEVPVDYKSQALATVQDRIGDKDTYLTCGGTVYDSDEISVVKIYDDYSYQSFDKSDGKYAVTFTAKFKFTDGSDNSPCRDTRTYKVTYENGEHPVVDLL